MNDEEASDSLIDLLKFGKKVYDKFAVTFKTNYLIAGKSIEEWEKQFKITIPEDLSPAACKNLGHTLLDLHQEASFYKAAARAYLQALKKGSDSQYKVKFAALVQKYQTSSEKLPAAKTLESLTKSDLDDVDTAIMAATIAVDFWEDMLSHLAFCRKLLENIVINFGIEAKLK